MGEGKDEFCCLYYEEKYSKSPERQREGIIEVLGVGVGETVSAVAPEIWRLCLIYCGADIVCHL